MKRIRLFLGALIPSVLLAMTACSTSATPEGSPPLEGTNWRLASLAGQPVPMPAGVREVYLMLDGKQHLASGFAGCNQFSAGYTQSGASLRFERARATLMACPAMVQERAYLDALAATAGWRMAGERLQLLDAQGKPQAEFVARAAQ